MGSSRSIAAGALLMLALSGCTGSTAGDSAQGGTAPAGSAATPGAATGGRSPQATATPAHPVTPVTGGNDGATTSSISVPHVSLGKTLAAGLTVPWGIAFLPDGSGLVAQRKTGLIIRLTARGTRTTVGTVPGVRDIGEGGLLGLALKPSTTNPDTEHPATLFAYFTSTSNDNRVVAMTYDGSRLGAPRAVIKGIGAADHHNGGLVTVGPDGKLWIGTGDGGVTDRSQDRNDLGGKILRVDQDGSIPADNPFPGSPVYSYGHRNVQGLAFDSTGQPWATEFGQNTWDELNRIVPGGNYGWPIVEGQQKHQGFIEPLVQWPTADASPSGLAIVDDVAYVGALRGERIWAVPLHGTTVGTPQSLVQGRFGRIRTIASPDPRHLWVTTSNRDGRGSPTATDDRVLRMDLG